MFARFRHRRFAAWLALLAVLWGALVPTLAQAAVSGSSRQGWVEVCSASGVMWVRFDGATASSTGQSAPMADASAHCPWCPMQGAAGLLPELALVVPVSGQGPVPTTAFTSAHPASVWSSAHSRAPPTD